MESALGGPQQAGFTWRLGTGGGVTGTHCVSSNMRAEEPRGPLWGFIWGTGCAPMLTSTWSSQRLLEAKMLLPA